ncbi:heme peroxidase [Mycena metata]|uniref:Peroxidase n=1 Tax=Mycena metata TaxID=1033252 RepID=A0AAD7MR37_9AGAR|nr:heme peroxidase [Mycena metata]
MLQLIFLALLVTVNGYVWPSPQLDALESARFEQLGHNEGIAGFVDPCIADNFEVNGSGRSDAADWIRNAYHDMATHNIMDGTGGLDASIRFAEEQARPENAGDGFLRTSDVLSAIANQYISIADAFAIGAIIAIENCGGPEIAFRGGRVDAGEPNAPGVPQPQQDLQSHIGAFARQGFTQTEMISLIACGHTFGGVQHAAFPNVVPEFSNPNDTLSVAHFDSTFVHFDNNIAMEYISGTTKNPLVVGMNNTTNSDKRIFGSDGNATMASFAKSPELYASTCATLFARMLDTVPKGVELTEVITPLPVKPEILTMLFDNGTVQFSGEVRFWNMTLDETHAVNLLWDDHIGGTHNLSLHPAGVSTSTGGLHSAAFYSILDNGGPLLLDAAAGIKNMRFVVDGKLEDQGGIGFPVQDGVLYSTSSCITSGMQFFPPFTGRFDIAVRDGLDPTRVFLERLEMDNVGRPIIVETDVPRPDQPVPTGAGYSIWSINLTQSGIDAFAMYTLGAEVNGEKLVLFGAPQSISQVPRCPT